MLDLRRGVARNHVSSSDPFTRKDSSHDSFSSIDFGTRARRTAQNYENYARMGDGGIELGAPAGGEDASDPSSPPLWKTSPPMSPKAKAPPLHHHHHRHYRSLSPTSRADAITRGQQELMEMVQNMPESCYELSLRDLVEHPTKQGVQVNESDLNNTTKITSEKGKMSKKNGKKGQLTRSTSMDSGVFLLKMFFPISLGSKKKKNSTMGTCSKVSPRPPLLEGHEKAVDKEWWKKRFSVGGDSSNGGTRSISASIGSSSSSNGSRSRHMAGCLPELHSFFQTKRSNTR